MPQTDSPSALVLFSGGQDSTTCLAWALERYEHVETVGFAYGQRHSVELKVREPILRAMRRVPRWGDRLGADRIIGLEALGSIAESELLRHGGLGKRNDGLPATFVPGRNVLFLAYAAIVAAQRGINVLVGGMCETDYSGYPDCRDDTLKLLQVALNLGMATKIRIETPLMWLDKAQTWGLAYELGGAELLNLVIENTHTCYAGDREHRHDWGYGCAECDACRLRKRGWDRYAEVAVV